MSHNGVPIGILNGAVVFAWEGTERLHGVTCFTCGRDVIHKRGERKEAHFAHLPGTPNCDPERKLHKLVVKLISEKKSLKLPDFMLARDDALLKRAEKIRHFVPEFALSETHRVAYSATEKGIRNDLGYFIPDITFELENYGILCVEVVVSNPVSEEKTSFYKRSQIPCLSINLSAFRVSGRAYTMSMIEDFIEDPSQHPAWSWINPHGPSTRIKSENYEKELLRLIKGDEARVAERRANWERRQKRLDYKKDPSRSYKALYLNDGRPKLYPNTLNDSTSHESKDRPMSGYECDNWDFWKTKCNYAQHVSGYVSCDSCINGIRQL